MKFNAILFSILPTALALPTTGNNEYDIAPRQSLNAVTDELLFSLSLPAFTSRRNARNPPTLDWSSDNCSWSPDNPLGYPFEPACDRHDFGYRNYKAQGRFTDAGKLSIDNNFRDDVSGSGSGCTVLANVYYAAVRAFGRSAPADDTLRVADAGLVEEYNAAVTEWEAVLKEAQEKSEVPASK